MIFSDPPDIPVITKYIECILYFNSRTKSTLFNVAKKNSHLSYQDQNVFIA